MAIQREMTMLVRPRDDAAVRVANTDARFPPREFELAAAIPPHPRGDWVNYVKAAGQGLAARGRPLRGFEAVVTGDIPVAAGLSSSSALVVASALAMVCLNHLEIDRRDLMSLLARSERYTGTKGGGMDQAICLGGRRGHALKVDFSPLRLTPTAVPSDWRFVVAFSLVPAHKSGGAQQVYNQRTRECQDALNDVVRSLAMRIGIRDYATLMADVDPSDLLAVGEELLADPLCRRFRHVVSEATRVEKARAAMETADIVSFGRLMTESHASLRDDYQVSCPALDRLVGLAMDSGAVGARLTGAGFGGCVVALCSSDRAGDVIGTLTEKFYANRHFEGSMGDQLFVAVPSDGASVVRI